jgi:hypothetical protein
MTNKDSDKRFDEKFPDGVMEEYNAKTDTWENDITDEVKSFLHQELDRARKETKRTAIKILTEDISHSRFIDNGRNDWKLSKERKDRGIEPCIECSNAKNIRKFLDSLNKK